MNAAEGLKIRALAYRAFRQWQSQGLEVRYDDMKAIELLARLFETTTKQLHSGMTDRQCDMCRAMGGPHGYAVYRALEARLHEEGQFEQHGS